MEIHPDKYALLQITNLLHPVNFIYNIHTPHIHATESAQYLGVTIDNKLSWESHIKSTFQKASFILFFLERNVQKCHLNIKSHRYNLVCSILDYGSRV